VIAVVLAAGCTGTSGPGTATPSRTTPGPTPSVTVTTVTTPYTPPAMIATTPELVVFVANAAAYARENGREKAIEAFNNPNGTFVIGSTHIFAIQYDGVIIADSSEPGIVGTNIQNMTDSFGTPLVQNLAQTARFGRGFVSYTYLNAERNSTIEPEITMVEDVDGSYYVAAGMFASEGEVYPSVILNMSGEQPGVDDLVAYVKGAVEYARTNGKDNALAVFNDPKGPFVQGELVMMAFDYNGTNLASPPYSPELTRYHINLINYHDPDGVDTIRGMRDIARDGGGFFYAVARVKAAGKEVYVPKINYAEPVDGNWWVFSGIIVPEYARVGTGDMAGIQVRNRTRAELYQLVNRAVTFAKINGKEKTFAVIDDPGGQFVNGDLFVWAESSDGTLLADPFWKSGIGRNQLNYTDRYGMKTTQVGIEAMMNGTGFSHALFPNTAVNGTADVPKLIFMKAVDGTWWIGGGIYGVEVR
ncbi:MAG: cache domain-containing protein, partial [Methanoregulaceae archaeon]|nr:cache domain-containing protein [Methanoregulaceae archaeon]